MRPANIETDFWEDFCERTYGINVYPDTEHWNSRYGATGLAATRIIFTNGGEDPWQGASVTETENPEIYPIVIDCDDCAHCVDLHGDYPTDSPLLTEARAQVADFFGQWIEEEFALESKYPTEAKASLRELLRE